MNTGKKILRKLRAILSADVKGYSLLMAKDETSTIQILQEYRHIMSEIIKQHSGRVIDAVGDNLLAEFPSAVDAVQCSVEIQKDLKQKNKGFPEDKRLEFRIGINVGDVIQEGDHIYGSGVNVAARIEGLAEPGGICISRNAYDHINGKLNLGYQYLGDHEVKNINHPVRVYKVLMDIEDAGKVIGEEQKPLLKTLAWSTVIVASIMLIAYLFFQKPTSPEFEPSSVEKMAFTLPENPSIAVLAFDNMTGDSNQEYFSDGIAEEIISALSRIDQLFVVARNSSFFYKGKPVKIKQISEELGVRYVLEGSVRSSGDKFRITVQLIDAVKGRHVWAKNYDHNFGNILKIQSDISLNIVQNLRIKLTEGEEARVFLDENINPKVFYKQLEAMSHYRKYTREGLERYGQLAHEIVDIDPDSPIGYRLLGWYHYSLAKRGISPRENNTKAFKMAQKALTIDEFDGFTHGLLGYVYMGMKKYEKAIVSGKRSVELQPNGAEVHFVLGSVLGYAGSFDEAIVYLKQAIRLNPFPTWFYYYQLGRCYMFKEQFGDALTEYNKSVQSAPKIWVGHWSLAINYIYLGRNEEARASAAKAVELKPNLSVSYLLKILNYKNQAHTQYLIDATRKAGFPD